MRGMRVGALASGSGTVLDAVLAAGVPVAVVVVDRPCRATEVADRHRVSVELVERGPLGPSFDRLAFTERVVDALARHDVELVAMAGFMTILEKPAFDAFGDRILNTHPSLLPAFPGAHAVEDALAFGVKVTGCTVHVATIDVDAGPILAQECVAVRPDDSAESLHERIKEVERRLYPATIMELIS